MNLTIVIEHLRRQCPTFENRVAGAARFKTIDENTSLDVPAAFVIPLDDNPGASKAMNDVRQMLTDAFSVVVALSNTPDERGQNAANIAHDNIRTELWAALLGWQPDGLADQSRYDGIVYQGGSLLYLDRARLWYQFDFGADMEIGPDDGWQSTALDAFPHYDGATVNIDAIDPEADPNLQYPGPDGRIEHTVTSPPTGVLD